MSMLAPPPKFQAIGVDGLPLVGGRLYTYGAGTSTPKDTYTSFALSASNTNPIILDARGEASVWMFGSYRFVLKDANDVLIWDVDDLRDNTNSATLTGVTLTGTLTVSSSSVTWAGNPTHSGNHTFTNNVTFNGNVTIGDSTVDSLTIKPTAVTWGTTTTHSGAHTWSGIQTFSANPAGRVIGSTYVPTLSTDTNCSAVSAVGLWRYQRVGNNVKVDGTVSIDPVSTTTPTIFKVSLPIATTMTAATDLSGVCTFDSSGVSAAGYCKALNTDYTLAWCYHTSVNTSAYTGYVSLSYEVK
jgi:hypothetical protein